FRSNECPAKDYTVKLSTGEMNPALGMTYVQFAMQGLKRQLSQGAGGWSVDAGPHYAIYRLLDSALPSTTDGDGHEKDFFDGIDTTLPGLATRLGDEGKKVPFLKPALVNLDNVAAHARAATLSRFTSDGFKKGTFFPSSPRRVASPGRVVSMPSKKSFSCPSPSVVDGRAESSRR